MGQVIRRALFGAVLGGIGLAVLLPPPTSTPGIVLVVAFVTAGAVIALAVGFAGDWSSIVSRSSRQRGKD